MPSWIRRAALLGWAPASQIWDPELQPFPKNLSGCFFAWVGNQTGWEPPSPAVPAAPLSFPSETRAEHGSEQGTEEATGGWWQLVAEGQDVHPVVLGGSLAGLCLPPAHWGRAQPEGCLPGLPQCCGDAFAVMRR